MLSKHATSVASTCVVVALLCATTACASSAKHTTAGSAADVKVEAGQPFPSARCAANRAVGQIRYVSGFDFAAAASIVDVLVAKQKGYFDALCLDVVVQPGDSADDHALVASGAAQFASSGSFSELVESAATKSGAAPVALAVEGQSAIDTLIVKSGGPTTLAGLRGAVIGVHSMITPSVQAMLAKAGLVLGTDYTTKDLPGFDPTTNVALAGIAAITGFQSNEPGDLDRAGVTYSTFVPESSGIPGSFGVIYSSAAFVKQHPTAAEDFMRAAMQGLADAVADPNAASMIAVDFIDNSGNPDQLSTDGERFRWQTESKLVVDGTPSGAPLGLPVAAGLKREVDAYAKIGMFHGKAPKITALYDTRVLGAIYDSTNHVIWPAKALSP
ncbi:MAG TPA: ABC transporter substrate-binding protein [Ilumatobacteraceae bacterium]|jgi:NitT/TauT family transport system substrate-binding protein